MKNHLRSLTLAALCLAVSQGAVADEVVMNNGDRLTGTVKTTKEGKLVLATSYAGDIEIALEDVKHISTDEPVKLVLDDQTKVSGTLSATDGTEMRIEGDVDPELKTVSVERIAAINPPVEPHLKISGQLNGGFERDRGNTDEDTYHVDGEAIFRWIDSRFSIKGDGDLEKNNNKKTKQKGNLGFKYDYFFDNEDFLFHEQWYLWSGVLFEHDKFADLDLRTTVGLGPGYQVIDTERTELSLEAGPSYVWERFDESEDQDYASARWALDFRHQLFEQWQLKAFHNHTLIWSVEDTNDYVFKSETGLRIPIFDRIQATLQFNFDRDNAPSDNAKKNDYETLITGGYTW